MSGSRGTKGETPHSGPIIINEDLTSQASLTTNMPPNIHLTTVVGSFVKQLPHMLAHYRELGLDSFVLNVQITSPEDPVLAAVRRVAEEFGCGIGFSAKGDWQQLIRSMYARARESRPDDWFVLADQDELQVYPMDLCDVINYCEQKGYDYIRGVVIDRISADGSFPELDNRRPIWEQFPLGGLITYAILGGGVRKVVAAKGRIPLVQGQHYSLGGAGCPTRDCLVQVHHFKWIKGIAERLERRAKHQRMAGVPHWIESHRFVSYYYSHGGRIQIDDPRLMISDCNPVYKHWQLVCRLALHWANTQRW
jgi:hypothetical protein